MNAVERTRSYLLLIIGNPAIRWPPGFLGDGFLAPRVKYLNRLRFRDPDDFRGGMIHGSLPKWECPLANYSCSTVDLLEIVREC